MPQQRQHQPLCTRTEVSRNMLRNLSIYVLLLLVALISQQCAICGGSIPGDTMGAIAANRYNAEQQQQQQQQHQHHQPSQQQQQQQHHIPHTHAPAVIPAPSPGGSHGQYHPGPGSGHMDNRNSYNLLSEAMSQAVSNEFSSLGSGSADGACHADDLDCYGGNVQDRLGMEAIRSLHRQLDDDDNGNIDLSESDDFLREELKYDSGYEKRQKAFHFNDDMHISVKELWEAWLRSEVHNWTMEQTTDWLAQSVQLPQYVELFKQHKVTGASLPRLAVNNMHYVSNVLGIKDPIHKQKIALKAMDVVLFGPPRETGTRWKDYILVTLLLSAIIGCWYAYQQNKNAKRHLRRMAQDMEGLQRAEQSLQEMQKELERARMEQENVATEKMDLERRLKEAPSLSSSSSDLEVQQLKKEIEMLRTELSRAEFELVDNCWAPPPQLQQWLQYTYELESKNHLKKRMSAEKQLQSAREACEKLRKKRSSLVGAFVSTHGKSIDDVDRSIVEARTSLGEVTNELQERLHRWKQIENCLGFNIVNNNGFPYLESVLYGRNGGGGSTKGSRGARITSSTDDLDDESVQGMMDSYSRSSAGVGGGGSSSIMNSSSNTICDDSSCSDDGDNVPHPVQFMLGGAPTPPSLKSVTSNAVTARAHLPLDVVGINHVSNAVAPASAAVSSNTPNTATPPPLPPHATTTSTNAHTSFNLNDSVIGDNRQHSPSVSSVSSERSIPVPPRSKKLNATAKGGAPTTSPPPTPPPLPPPPLPPTTSVVGGTSGRAPLPPPRKSSQSPLLRSQSTDLVPMEIYTYISRHHQQQQQQPSQHSVKPSSLQGQPFHGNGGGGGGGTNIGAASVPGNGGSGNGVSHSTSSGGSKKMVKQLSTASQQSTSSTSSSVQSAPSGSTAAANTNDGSNWKGNSPGRWSSHEHQLFLRQQQHQQQQQQQQQQQHCGDKEPLLQSQYTGVGFTGKAYGGIVDIISAQQQQQQQQMSGALSLQSLCGKPQYGSGVSTATTASAATVASSHSDTQLEDNQLLLASAAAAGADSVSVDGASLKKRKRKLRFPFGSSRKSNNNKSNSGSAGKLT